jgi:hypothetical protein
MQAAIASYLDGLAATFPCDIAWAHPPNEGSRDIVYAKKLKGQGVKAGDLDVALYMAGGCTVFVELKTFDGSMKPEQLSRIATLSGLGFTTYVIAAIAPAAAVDAMSAVVGTEVLSASMRRSIGPKVPFRVPYMTMTPLSWYVWPGRDVVATGHKSVTSIIRHYEKQSR